MIITEEIKALALKTCQNPDPHMRHCLLIGFYAGYAAAVRLQQKIDPQKRQV